MDNPSRQRFNALAAEWDQNPGRVEFTQAVADAILRQISLREDMDMLDYGCGTGLVMLAPHPHVRSIVGADVSEGMLSVLNGKIAAQGLANVRTVLLDLQTDQPLPDRFDLITSGMTMHHVRDVGVVLGKLRQMLRPGGFLAIADLEEEGGAFHGDPTGVEHHGFDREHMVRLFRAAGLASVQVTTAYVIKRPLEDGTTREFPVFLVTGQVEE